MPNGFLTEEMEYLSLNFKLNHKMFTLFVTAAVSGPQHPTELATLYPIAQGSCHLSVVEYFLY